MEAATESGVEGGAGGEVEIRCPSCRKAVVTALPPPDDLACPRCRCSLALLVSIRCHAARLVREGCACLVSGDHAGALRCATTAWDLHHTRAAAALAFIAATVDGDALEGVAWLRASRVPGLP